MMTMWVAIGLAHGVALKPAAEATTVQPAVQRIRDMLEGLKIGETWEKEEVEEEEQVWNQRPRRQVWVLRVVLVEAQPRQRERYELNLRQLRPREVREAGSQLAEDC